VVDLIGRAAIEPRVRAVAVVPRCELQQFRAECFATQRDEQPACPFFLKRSDEPLDYGDAPLFADGAESWAYAAALAPVW